MKLKQIIIFISIFEAIIIALHALVYFAVIFLFGIQSPHARIDLAIILGILSLVFVLSMLATWNRSTLIGRIFYRMSAAWMTFIYFFTAASVITLVLYLILPIQNNPLILPSVMFGIATILGLYSLINGEIIRIVRHEIQLSAVPEFWQSKTLAFVSDIHLGSIHGQNYAKRVTKKLNTLDAQAILIGGDMFDGPAIDAVKAIEPFRDVRVPLGMHFISGNHDEFNDPTKFFHAIEGVGIHILDDKTVDLQGIAVTGVDYLKTNSREKFQRELEKISLGSGPNILLKHVPDHLDLAAAKGFDATFSGHTHNGQMFPFGYIARRSYGYNYGIAMLNKMTVMVSSGVGTWGPPGRFGTKSEIIVISFK